jgi:hypothetical protein
MGWSMTGMAGDGWRNDVAKRDVAGFAADKEHVLF